MPATSSPLAPLLRRAPPLRALHRSPLAPRPLQRCRLSLLARPSPAPHTAALRCRPTTTTTTTTTSSSSSSSSSAAAAASSTSCPHRLSTRPLHTKPRRDAPTVARSLLGTTLLVSLVGVASYLVGSLYPPTALTLLFPRPPPPRLRDGSPEALEHTERLERALHELPLVRELKSHSIATGAAADLPATREGTRDATQTQAIPADGKVVGANVALSGPGLEGGEAERHLYVMTRPYVRYDAAKAQHALTAGSLRGPGMLALPPLVFAKTAKGAQQTGGSEGDAIIVIHLGRSLCGHDGIIHGGMLATLCDEALARTAMYNLPGRIGVTAKLELNYRKPTLADQFVVVRTRLVEAKGRKACVEGRVEDTAGTTLLECKSVFVEPKYARYFLDVEGMQRNIEG
ncbi:hypothetical protein ACQY0O_005338 [Thecaphora frezii]